MSIDFVSEEQRAVSKVQAPFFERIYDLGQVPRDGLHDRIEATAAERASIAAAQGLPALTSLALTFELKPLSRDRFRLRGQLEGVATQQCVVSLEPLEAHVDEAVDLELWPAEQVAPTSSTAPGAEVEVRLDGPEPYSGGTIDLGQIAYELFAAALDPYPRKPGAEFTWTEPAPSGADEGPFAALRTLKRS